MSVIQAQNAERRMAGSVLVVDDEEDSRLLLSEILRIRGFEVRVAGSGAECLTSVDAEPLDVTVVITDVEMPGMTGFELCERLRARYPRILTILISGRATASAAPQVRECGALALLHKPVDTNELERLVRLAFVS